MKLKVTVIIMIIVLTLTGCAKTPVETVDPMAEIRAEYAERLGSVSLEGFSSEFLREAKAILKEYSEKNRRLRRMRKACIKN